MKSEFIKLVVLDVIFDPNTITVDRLKYYESLGLIPNNFSNKLPRNTILGKQILEQGGDVALNPMFFFPFFPPHLSMPCKPGEHMWGLLETDNRSQQPYGYWFNRITEVWAVDDLNHTHPPRLFEPSFYPDKKDVATGINSKPVFEFNNGQVNFDTKGNRYVADGTRIFSIDGINDENTYEFLVNKDEGQINAARLTPAISVPRYKKRPGDISLEGSNNTLIVLGTDRKNIAAEYKNISVNTGDGQYQLKAPVLPTTDLPFGSIDIVTGRGQQPETSGESAINSLNLAELNKVPNTSLNNLNEGNPDLVNDVSRIRLSEKTKVDSTFEISDFNISNFSISDSVDGDGAIVLKSDKIRLIARKDVEILVNVNDSADTNSYAAVVIKTDGSIVFKPSTTGYIKLGGDDADKALLCTDYNALQNNGNVSAVGPLGAVIVTTDGASFGSGAPNQGTVATKILVK